ncbi:BTAD domain-containing putative transcriptional regulator [Nonomuraea polychroma]|uniref:BTAD domain-containing putative transcriptional regulator n=1 Tax=Nonomuraea polychroma TaxID=46176 RepID=UPI003D8BAF33
MPLACHRLPRFAVGDPARGQDQAAASLDREEAAPAGELHVEGRQAEALKLYERTRRLLADQLGVDPGAELQATFEALLSRRT